MHTCNFNLLISVRTREIISLKVTNKIKKISGIYFLLSDIHTLNVTYILWILLNTLSKWISSGLSPWWSFIAHKFEFHSRPLNPTRSNNCQFKIFSCSGHVLLVLGLIASSIPKTTLEGQNIAFLLPGTQISRRCASKLS